MIFAIRSHRRSRMCSARWICVLAALAVSNVGHAASLCAAGETVVFNCKLKENKKLVSLCSSKDLSNRAGFLQYRYGSSGKIELTYPEIKTGSQLHFGYDAYSRADLSTFILGFENGIYRYELSETTEGGEQEVATRELLVGSPNHRRDMHLTCLDDANLTSNISTLESVVPCDRNHEIVDGGCR
ncbi:hypothetical protein ACS0Y7_36155 [Burkholderia gladioli]|uniref:hypothetical protein n=1 Tax=Burkholderia gladioli TaxID=28095 RepID=UPI003F7A42EE